VLKEQMDAKTPIYEFSHSLRSMQPLRVERYPQMLMSQKN
jgi:hypothetical protein